MSAPGIDRDQIARFVDAVFSWCDGLIPLRGLPEKGVTPVPSNDLRWIPADAGAPEIMATAAEAAASVGRAIYVIPGTVGHNGDARAEHVRQMQALVVDLDEGDISAKRDHLIRNLGPGRCVGPASRRPVRDAAQRSAWPRPPAAQRASPTLCRPS